MPAQTPDPVKLRNTLAVINCLTDRLKKDMEQQVKQILREVQKLEDQPIDL